MSNSDILIVGAGPTGLVLALSLAKRGISVRIVDLASGPGLASRAMIVHARPLEFYDQLGFADEMVGRGVRIERIHLREGGKEAACLSFGDIGQGLSPYPFLLAFPQDDHERFLVEKLQRLGVRVEWNTSLENFTQNDAKVSATLAQDDRREVVDFAYLCGCDGAHSAVRVELQVGFPGGTYDQLFYVADVKVEGGFTTEAFMNLARGGFALLLPVRSSGMQRLIGIAPEGLEKHANATFDDVRAYVEPILGFRVTEVNWFSLYHVSHRVAADARVGRTFLVGDALHIHSPVGGQGMNTGIGDAVNLGWKLAEVTSGRANASLLDSYAAERLPFAHKLVATTDRAFSQIIDRSAVGTFLRTWAAPNLFSFMTGFSAVRRWIFRTVSQTEIGYRGLPLASGRAGDVEGGDRLPWVTGSGTDNFASLRSLRWQVHVYGEPGERLIATAARLGLPVERFGWSAGAETVGLMENACYLIRPDGHVALATPDQDVAALDRYMERLGLHLAQAA